MGILVVLFAKGNQTGNGLMVWCIVETFLGHLVFVM